MDNLKEELKTYVQNHINERIRLEELEKYFFYSKFHLCRKFKKKTGCTIMTYISNIKLEEAKRELQNGICASQVADKYGYETVNGFNKAYKKKYGYPPSLERKLQNEKK